MIVRRYVNGRRVDIFTRPDDTDLDEYGAEDAAWAMVQEKAGHEWMVEVIFPDGEEIRMGNTPKQMWNPITVERGQGETMGESMRKAVEEWNREQGGDR